MAEFVASVPLELTVRLKARNDREPRGVLAVCNDFDSSRADGSAFTYVHGVATSSTEVPDGAELTSVAAGSWLVLDPADASDAALQALWSYAFGEWFPANPYSLAPGPEIVAMQRDGDALSRTLWLPITRGAGS